MKTYTIVGGVNGTGKSSFTSALKVNSTDLGVIVDVDQITAAVGGKALAGGRIALKKINDCLEKGVCFTQESTLSGSFVQKTAKKALDAGYFIRLYYIGLDSAEESLARIANRVRRGGHDIPQEDVLRRFADRWKALAAVLPYCEEAHFYDNDNGFREVAVYQNGELLLLGEHRPRWTLELKAYFEKAF
jgi:predicted ABC-type ATPase